MTTALRAADDPPAPHPRLRVMWAVAPQPMAQEAASAQRRALAAAFAACREDCQVLIVTGPQDCGPQHSWPALGIAHVPIDEVDPQSRGVVILPQLRAGLVGMDVLVAWRLDKLRDAFAPHVVHSHDPHTLRTLGSLDPGRPAHATTLDAAHDRPAGVRTAWQRFITRVWIKRVDALITTDAAPAAAAEGDPNAAPTRHVVPALTAERADATVRGWLAAYRDALARADARKARWFARTRASAHPLDWVVLAGLAWLALHVVTVPFVTFIAPQLRHAALRDGVAMAAVGIAVGVWRMRRVRARYFRELCGASILPLALGGGLSLFHLLRMP